jgi:hypothetical protein
MQWIIVPVDSTMQFIDGHGDEKNVIQYTLFAETHIMAGCDVAAVYSFSFLPTLPRDFLDEHEMEFPLVTISTNA